MRAAIAVALLAAFTSVAPDLVNAEVAPPGSNLDATLRRSAFIDPPGERRPATAPAEPRLAPVGENGTPEQRDLIARFVAAGNDDHARRTLAHAPQIAEESFALYDYVETASSLPPYDRELLILRSAWLTQSPYLWARHAQRAMKQGMNSEQIRAIASGDKGRWSSFEQTLLDLADELFRNSSVTDRTWSALTARYQLLQSMDAVVTVSRMIEAGVLFNSLGVQPEDNSRPLRLPTDIKYRLAVSAREPALTVARVLPTEGTTGLIIARTIRQHPKLAEKWYAMPERSAASDATDAVTNHDRELVILRIGWNCQSDYEWAQHVGSVGRARDHGIEPLDVARGTVGKSWTDKDRALIRAVDEMYRDSMVSEATWRDLQANFSPTQLVTLLTTAARYRRVSIVLNALGVQTSVEDERLPVLKD